MFSSQVIIGISGGVLGIVGLLLVLSAIRQRRVNWIIGLGAFLFVLGLFLLVTELPQYALGFSILATLAMAFAALLNIQQSADRENRDRRERLLNDIIDWAIEIRSAPLRKEFTPGDIPEAEDKNIKRNTLLAYSIPLSRSIYIRELTRENFKGDIITFINDTIKYLSAFIYLQYMGIKDEYPALKFGKVEESVIKDIGDELTISANDLDTIMETYDKELNKRIDRVFEEAAKLISTL